MKKLTVILCFFLWISGSCVALSALTEPDSIIYGKITNHYNGYEQILYDGILNWQISRGNETFVFTTSLESLSDGKYSYKLAIPEKAAVMIPNHLNGDNESNKLLLGSTDRQYDHINITINGKNARIKEPGKAYMIASQRKRGQAMQLDLEMTDLPEDSDSDGMPDFWEELNGFNKNLADDALLDNDQDGWTSLEEFNKGTDPFVQNTVASLLPSGKVFYAAESEKTLFSPDIFDSDTALEDILVSMADPPVCGNLIIKGQLNDQDSHNTIWNSGMSISARQIHDGWIHYAHSGDCAEDLFMIELWDQDTSHAAKSYSISVYIKPLAEFTGENNASQWSGYVLSGKYSKTKYVKRTAPSGSIDQGEYEEQFINEYGRDEQYLFVGGQLNDELTGGHENDILFGGTGKDTLSGKSGSDIFIADNGDIVTDFNRSEKDVIDISRLLVGKDRNLENYLFIENDGIHTRLKIDPEGNQNYVQEIKLLNTLLINADAYELWADKQLITGNVRHELILYVQEINSSGIETMGQDATARIYFSQSRLPQGMLIPITISGTAEYEKDYQLLAKRYNNETRQYELVNIQSNIPVQLKPGDSHIEIHMSPKSDNIKEDIETLNILFSENQEFYDIDDNAAISMTISDGPDVISIENTSTQISEENTSSEAFILKRTGALDDSLVVKMNIQGTAANGIDYQYIPSEWTMPANADRVTIDVIPYTDRFVENPHEIIDISIAQSDDYQVDSINNRSVMQITDLPIEIHLKTVNNIAERNWKIPAAVQLVRSTIVDTDISVQLKLTGSAINGRDFEWMSDTINFGAGLSTISLSIQPKASNSTDENNIKTLCLEILPQSPYVCGFSKTTTIYIIDEKLSFRDWAAGYFPENKENINDIMKQDPDADGISNFEEYAYGLEPDQWEGQQEKQKIHIENNHLTLEFGRSLITSGVNFQVEISEDLQHWQTGNTHIKFVKEEFFGNRIWETWKSVKSVLPGKAQFMRIRLESMQSE